MSLRAWYKPRRLLGNTTEVSELFSRVNTMGYGWDYRITSGVECWGEVGVDATVIDPCCI